MASHSQLRRVHLLITGYVQGVGFRYAAQRRAQALGLHGWVRNTSDGAVEAAIEGSGAAVDELVDWARSGPSGASVESIQSDEETPRGERGFRILT